MIWVFLLLFSFFIYRRSGVESFIIFIIFLTMIAGIFNGGGEIYAFTVDKSFFSEYSNGYSVVKAVLMILVVIYLSTLKPGFSNLELITILTLLVFPVFISLSSVFNSIGLSSGFFASLLPIIEILFCFLSIKFILNNSGKEKLISDLSILFSLFVIFLFLGLIFEPTQSLRAARFRGVSGSANWMASYLCFINILLLNFYLYGRKRLITNIGLMVGILLLFLTGSRTAIFIYMIIFIYTVMSKRDVKLVINIAFISLLMVSVVFIFNVDFSSYDISRVVDMTNTRESVWLRGYLEFYNSNDFLIGTTNSSSAVESVYLSILFVYGYFGIIFFIPMFFMMIYFSIKPVYTYEEILGKGILISFLCISILENIYFGKIASFNIFLYLAISFIVIKDKNNNGV